MQRFERLFCQPMYAGTIAYMRVVVFGFLVYKLLSRDFSIVGMAPDSLLSIYPNSIFPVELGFYTTATRFPIEMATGHWIHWFVPRPTVSGITIIQWGSVTACLVVILFGRGRRGWIAAIAFLLSNYLWGYLWRSGSDLDAMALPLQLALLYCFFPGPEALVIGKPAMVFAKSDDCGWFYSMGLLLFGLYYCWSGINKMLDIDIIDWLDYPLGDLHRLVMRGEDFGYIYDSGPFRFLAELGPWFDKVGVPAVYFMEIAAPLCFFYRRLVPVFYVFFVVFHFATWGHMALFFGNIVMWQSLLPIDGLLTRIRSRRTERFRCSCVPSSRTAWLR